MSRTVVILSGGMDSATLLWDLKRTRHLDALFVDYGQRHIREERASLNLAERAGVHWKRVDLSSITPLINRSSQTGEVDVPHGHYADENMKLTVVPNRNMIMLSVAIGYAINIGASRVAYGAHAGDHDIYPDCRPAFVEAMQQAAGECHYEPVHIWAPYLAKDKGDICKLGVELGVPFDLTWTCYEGKDVPCGKCGACVERAEAFAKAGVEDPLVATA